MGSFHPANRLSHHTCSDECSQRPALQIPSHVQPSFSRVVVLIHVRGYPPQCMSEDKQEEYNVQVVCCCGLCVSGRRFGTSNNASANSSAGWHDHSSSLGMRPRSDPS